MNNLDIILMTLIIILALILLNFVLKYKKLKGDGQLPINTQILEFSKLIINITTEVMKLNNLTQGEFSSEEEFRKVLAGLVIEELNVSITEEDINNKYKFINELSDSEIEQLILNIFALYKKEIGIVKFITDTTQSVFNDEKRNSVITPPDQSESVIATSFIEKPKTVDITNELSKFNE